MTFPSGTKSSGDTIASADWNDLQTAVIGGWKFLAETELGSPSATVTFSGLDGNTDKIYMLVGEYDTNTTNRNLLVQFNSDTGANYNFMRFYGDGTTTTNDIATAATTGLIGIASTTVSCVFFSIIHAETGINRNMVSKVSARGLNTGTTATEWTDTTSNMTSIDLSMNGGSIGTGSIFRLYKRKND